MSYAIRAANGGDVAAIDALLLSAFSSPQEAGLVQALCVDGDMVLTLVADDEESGAVAGMIAFSRMTVEVGGAAVSAVALAPIAVAGAHRSRGVADALIRTGLRDLRAAGVMLCFVLGDPALYARHGFAADLAHGFESPYAGGYFMAVALQDGAIPCGVRGAATHAPAFARLGERG